MNQVWGTARRKTPSQTVYIREDFLEKVVSKMRSRGRLFQKGKIVCAKALRQQKAW